MPTSGRSPLLAGIPLLFVVLWSSGFVVAKIGLPHTEPLTFLTLRFSCAALIMGAVAVVTRATWPRSRRELGHLMVVGLFLQALYFGGSWISMGAGVGAGVSALIVCLQPVLTAAVAPLLGERIVARQWLGLAAGTLGVALVVANKLSLGLGTPAGMAWSFVGLASITIGTIYQKRFCPSVDPRTGSTVQFAVGAVLTGTAALAFENLRIEFVPELIFALVYVVVVLSLVSVTLLTLMIRWGAISRVASLFFLVPPTASVMAWLWIGETLTGLAMVGMALAVLGVALVMSAPAPVLAPARSRQA